MLVKICTHINIFSTLMIQLGLDLKYYFVHCVGKAYVESFVVEIINICDHVKKAPVTMSDVNSPQFFHVLGRGGFGLT